MDDYKGGKRVNYFDNNEQNKSKIPYDDTPINRSNSKRRKKFSQSIRTSKWTSVFMVVLIVLNVVLSYCCIHFMKNSRSKVINNYTLELGSSGSTGTGSEIETAYKTEAYLSSVSVAAGGTCTNEKTFYTSTVYRGSGVIYKIDESSKTIYFITCYHVINGFEDKVWVLLATSLKPIEVSVVAYSAHHDIAVLKYVSSDLVDTLSGCKAIKAFDSSYVSNGEDVFAIGNSLSSGLSITEGDVSDTNVMIRISGNSFDTRTIQTSAEINPGNSGGGLFNAKGEFIGLVNAKKHSVNSGSETVTVVGTAYAIPSNLVIGIADSLIKTKNKAIQVNLGSVFAHDINDGMRIEYVSYGGVYRPIETYTVYVRSVTSGSVAHGKLKANDVINAVEFSVVENGVTKLIKVNMFNQHIFDYYAFSIIEDSVITFFVKDGTGERQVQVVASAVASEAISTASSMN